MGHPTFVLDPKLQNEQKILKWNQCISMGQFHGFSDEHSSLVVNLRNLRNGCISHQYHVLVDDIFQTISSSGENVMVIDAICNELFDSMVRMKLV